MPEQPPYVPSESELKTAEASMSEEQRELSNKRESVLARIKTAEGGNPTIKAAREIGVPKRELTEYALRFLEKDIRDSYSPKTVRSIAMQSGVVTGAEIDALFKNVKAKMATEAPSTMTDEDLARKEAEWLEEMLKLCEEKSDK